MTEILAALNISTMAAAVSGILVAMVGINLGFMAYRQSKKVTSRA